MTDAAMTQPPPDEREPQQVFSVESVPQESVDQTLEGVRELALLIERVAPPDALCARDDVDFPGSFFTKLLSIEGCYTRSNLHMLHKVLRWWESRHDGTPHYINDPELGKY